MKYSKSEAKSWARKNMLGHWTTMVTPFTPDGELDEAGLRKNIRYVLSLGTEGMGFTWSFGEFWALTLAERKKIAEIAVDEVAGKALVGIHTFDPCVKDAIDLTKHAEAVGADLAILMSPSIAKTDQQVYQYFKSVADTVHIGIGIYNQPVVSGYMISPSGIAQLGDIENVVITKEAYPLIHQISLSSKPLEAKWLSAAPTMKSTSMSRSAVSNSKFSSRASWTGCAILRRNSREGNS